MLSVFRWLSKLKHLRGTFADPFGRTAERRLERQLLADYEADVNLIVSRLGPETMASAIELASLPEKIRGYGHVKAASAAQARPRQDALRTQLAATADACGIT